MINSKKKPIIIKESSPRIQISCDSESDENLISEILEFSNILQNLNIPSRKWFNGKNWIFERVNIFIYIKNSEFKSFEISGSQALYYYYASCNIEEKNKDQIDRLHCYEVTKNDLQIFENFFKSITTIQFCSFKNIWFHQFPLNICKQSNLKRISFYSCRIDEFPDEFKYLSSLEKFEMEFSWANMPISFANCKNLKKIEFIEACLIDKFPDDIGNCKNLKKIIYHENNSKCLEINNLKVQKNEKFGLKTLPSSIGKIPNLTHIELDNCDKLQALPEELAYFPWKSILLNNSGELMKNEKNFPKPLRDSVYIDWEYSNRNNLFYFQSEFRKLIKPEFDVIIDRLYPVYEWLPYETLNKILRKYALNEILFLKILEKWAEETHNKETKKLFYDFITKNSPKIKQNNGDMLFL
ncbi:MAG: hypothetical protein ACTSYY_04240 [Promethearchaeota archaeon]